MTPERIAEIETALEAGDELDPTVVVELLSAVKEARRSDAGRVDVPDRFDLGFIEACAILAAKPFDRPSVAASLVHEGGMVGALIATTSDGPGIAILRDEMHDQIVGHGIASCLSPSPQTSADVVVVPREDVRMVLELIEWVAEPAQYKGAPWFDALRSPTNPGQKGGR